MKVALSDFGISLSRYRGFLFYGYHEGLQRGLLEEMAEDLAFVSEEAFLENPSSFFTPTLFDVPRPVVVEEVSEKQAAAYKEWLDKASVPLILTSTSLKTQSSLVQHALQTKELGAVACYDPSLGDSRRILQRYIKRYKLHLEDAALELCVSLTQEGTWSSVSKMLHLCPQPITVDTVIKVIPEARCQHYSPLTLQKSSLYKALFQLYDAPVSEILSAIRLWQTQFMQLWPLAVSLQEGASLATSLSKITPPLFFKYKPFVESKASLWTPLFLKTCFCVLQEAELCAKSPLPKVAVQKLLQLCSKIHEA